MPITSLKCSAARSRRTVAGVRDPFALGGREMFVSASIGIALGEAATTTSAGAEGSPPTTAAAGATREAGRPAKPTRPTQVLQTLKRAHETAALAGNRTKAGIH